MYSRHYKLETAGTRADLLRGVQLPDRLHTSSEPMPAARTLSAAPAQPAADRPRHPLLPPDSAIAATGQPSTSGVSARGRPRSDYRERSRSRSSDTDSGDSPPPVCTSKSRTTQWRHKKRLEMAAMGMGPKPPRTFLCTICNEPCNRDTGHARYFGVNFCPNDPNQHLSLREWRERRRAEKVARNAAKKAEESRPRQP